jgi:hypothetical protein
VHSPTPESTHDDHIRLLLDEVAAGDHVSQRTLARRVGIALGLTNLLLKRLARRGLVRMVKVKPNRIAYFLTPAGFAAKARLSGAYFMRTTRFYAEARDRVRERFLRLSSEWPSPETPGKPVVFYGADEVAEIGFICLQETDLGLEAVVDETRETPFFGRPVRRPSELPGLLQDLQAETIVVPMSFEAPDDLAPRLARAGVPAQRIFWL